MSPRRQLAAGLLTAALMLGLPTAAPALPMSEFPTLTTPSNPQAIVEGPDGAMWFTEPNAARIGRIDSDGEVAGFPVPGLPVGIAVGPDKALWFTEPGTFKIGRITTDGAVTEFPVPSGGDPYGIIAGPDGAMWFTEFRGNRIGRITTAGSIDEFPIPTATSSPIGIAVGPDNALWFAESLGHKLGRISTGGSITETPGMSAPYDLVTGPDGALWVAEYGGRISRVTTDGKVKSYPLPASAGPVDIAKGADGALWFTENGGHRVGRITTAGSITEYPVPTVSPVPNPYGIAAGPGSTIWFTEFSTNKIGRITLPRAPEVAVAEAKLDGTAAKLTGSVTPNGSGTTYHFEYGTTEGYGSLTAPQRAGEGFDPVEAAASLSGLRQGTTYHFRLVAINAHETTVSADRAFTTPFLDADGDGRPSNLDCDDGNPAVHPGAIEVLDNAIDEDCNGVAEVNADRDGDGATRPADCDDANPRVHRGAVDLPQNWIDEDCDGADAQYPVTAGTALLQNGQAKGITRLYRLRVVDLTGGESILVRCKGRGCPLKRKRVTVKAGRETIGLTRLIRNGKLRPRAVVTVEISRPAAVTKVFTFTARKHDNLQITRGCRAPDEKQTRSCGAGRAVQR